MVALGGGGGFLIGEVPLYNVVSMARSSSRTLTRSSHGARPVHLIITMIKWIRTSRLSIKKSLSLTRASVARRVDGDVGGEAEGRRPDRAHNLSRPGGGLPYPSTSGAETSTCQPQRYRGTELTPACDARRMDVDAGGEAEGSRPDGEGASTPRRASLSSGFAHA